MFPIVAPAHPIAPEMAGMHKKCAWARRLFLSIHCRSCARSANLPQHGECGAGRL